MLHRRVGIAQQQVVAVRVAVPAPVESNTDDWNGRRSLLGETGSAILPLGVGALLMAGLGAAVVMVRRRKSAHDDKDAALMPRHAA